MLAMKKHSPDASPNEHASGAFKKREFEYKRSDFERVQRLIYERAGISFNDSKTELVYSRLSKRVRALSLENFKTYLTLLTNADHPEWEHFINALTTNLTNFFRESHHFPILANHALSVTHRPFRA